MLPIVAPLVPISPDGDFVITPFNSNNLDKFNLMKINSREHWHKFIIKNGASLDKDMVLNAILNTVSPIDLVPVKYTVSPDCAYFLARNCGKAIQQLCLSHLSVFPHAEGEAISLDIHVCHTPINEFNVNMQFHLKKAIQKRLDDSRPGYVNLSRFHKEQELSEILFCPLSRPRFLNYVLQILKQTSNLKWLDLSNNQIQDLKSLEFLQEFKELVSLDLSNNQIECAEHLCVLKNAASTLQNINLDGNPLCLKYSEKVSYVKDVLQQVPSICKLDNMPLFCDVPNIQVYLCNNGAATMVEQFLQHYFNLYDDNRLALEEVYHVTASLTATSYLSIDNAHDNRLNSYEIEKNSDTVPMFIFGNNNIAQFLWKLPLTKHDPYSFKVDLLLHQERASVIKVTGIFRDVQNIMNIRNFSRTFTLINLGIDEYKIMNELYYVTTASEDEISASFIHPKPPTPRKKRPRLNLKERTDAIEMVSKLTEMNLQFSETCLETADWDLKKALEIFLYNYKNCTIAADAFS